MALRIKHGAATTPTTEANASTLTVPPAAVGAMMQMLKAEGVPFVNGQPNPSVDQLRQLRDRIRMMDGVLE